MPNSLFCGGTQWKAQTLLTDGVGRRKILILPYERKPWIKVEIRIKISDAKIRDSNKT